MQKANEAELTSAGELPNNGSLATPINSASIGSISDFARRVNEKDALVKG